MSEYRASLEVLEFVLAVARAIEGVKVAEGSDLVTFATGVQFACEGEDIPVRLVPNDFNGYDVAIGSDA